LQWSKIGLILPALPQQKPQHTQSNPQRPSNAITETMPTATPHQSKGRHVRFPGSAIAAEELGVSRSHLHRVLSGERDSEPLKGRWNAWLKRHPEFAALQPKSA
jgi:hypothetical protein